MYEQGHGVPQDYQIAMEYYVKAADQGNTFAIRNIGISSLLCISINLHNFNVILQINQ